MTPFKRYLKEALYLTENVPEIKPIGSDENQNPIYPSGFDVFNPGGGRETVAPPGGGEIEPLIQPPIPEGAGPGEMVWDGKRWIYIEDMSNGEVSQWWFGPNGWELKQRSFQDPRVPAPEFWDEYNSIPRYPSHKQQLRDAREAWENENPANIPEGDHLGEWLECCAANGETFQEYLDRIEDEWLDSYPDPDNWQNPFRYNPPGIPIKGD